MPICPRALLRPEGRRAECGRPWCRYDDWQASGPTVGLNYRGGVRALIAARDDRKTAAPTRTGDLDHVPMFVKADCDRIHLNPTFGI